MFGDITRESIAGYGRKSTEVDWVGRLVCSQKTVSELIKLQVTTQAQHQRALERNRQASERNERAIGRYERLIERLLSSPTS
ncbi:MAG: hypothetical protein F6K19_43450 [Cyanothece sp. SIO1E1]|nr:hypothetical protein [Cyanothece sp. SIO1E1]